MPDVTGGQQGGSGGQGGGHVHPPLPHHVKLISYPAHRVSSSNHEHHAQLRQEPVHGDWGADGGMEEDAVRVSRKPPHLHSPHAGISSFPQVNLMGAASLPPMVGKE